MPPITALTDTLFVAPQIDLEDLEALKAQGFGVIVSNRPDHEEPSQPTAETVKDAAEALGLTFHHLPTRGMPDFETVEQLKAILSAPMAGKLLAFCKSGTRSAYALTFAGMGLGVLDPQSLIENAAKGGYDLRPLFR